MCCFFFSSRRRHTSCGRDWSSDVCSSDLIAHGYFCASSGLKAGHSLAACNIERHRSVVVHNQPIAVELPKAEGAPDPHQARRRPVLQRAAEPTESVPECHIITHGDGQVANLIVHILEERERPRPGVMHQPKFCTCLSCFAWPHLT